MQTREKKILKELEKIKSNRSMLRNSRLKSDVPIIAVVGYTNAGQCSIIAFAILYMCVCRALVEVIQCIVVVFVDRKNEPDQSADRRQAPAAGGQALCHA